MLLRDHELYCHAMAELEAKYKMITFYLEKDLMRDCFYLLGKVKGFKISCSHTITFGLDRRDKEEARYYVIKGMNTIADKMKDAFIKGEMDLRATGPYFDDEYIYTPKVKASVKPKKVEVEPLTDVPDLGVF